VERGAILDGLYLVGAFDANPPMKAIVLTYAADENTAIRNCLRYDEFFLEDVHTCYFCEGDENSIREFFAEHAEWADLYMALEQTYPFDGQSDPGPERLAAMVAFPGEMLAYIRQHGDVYEPTVLNLSSLPLIGSRNVLPPPNDLWLLYDDVEKTTVEKKIVAAPDVETARRAYAELGIGDHWFLEQIAHGGLCEIIAVGPASHLPPESELEETGNQLDPRFIDEVRAFFADHTDWADLYLAGCTAGDLSAETVASFPTEMLLYIYEIDRGPWMFSVDLGTIPLIGE
jgi:hypothetical protein